MGIEKKKAIIYGLGKRFNNDYFYKYLLPIIESKYEIVGVSDQTRPTYIDDIDYNFIEKSNDLKMAEIIIVTSDLYFDEIRDQLNEEFGINCIISLESIEEEIINSKLQVELFDGLSGVEVGGPSNIFRFLYKRIKQCDGVNFCSDTVWWKDNGNGYFYNGDNLGNVIIADAVDLSIIEDDSYEFCISSNNLEHIANPLKAVREIVRITKKNGIVLIIVPCKEECFDHNRSVTSFDHLLEDYINNIDEYDLSHLDEILELHDYEMDYGVSSRAEFEERAKNNYNNRCLHHHVFDEDTLKKIYEYFRISIIKLDKIFNCYFSLGRVENKDNMIVRKK